MPNKPITIDDISEVVESVLCSYSSRDGWKKLVMKTLIAKDRTETCFVIKSGTPTVGEEVIRRNLEKAIECFNDIII